MVKDVQVTDDRAGGDGRAGPAWSVPGSLAEPEEVALPRPDGGVAPADRGSPGSPAGPEAPAAPPGMPAGPADLGDLGGQLAPSGPLRGWARDAGGQVEAANVPSLKLQPMTVADILDGAFAIIKARPARILGIAALFVVPVNLFGAYLQRNVQTARQLWEDPAVLADASQSNSDGSDVLVSILLAILPALALVFVAAAVAQLVAAWSVGRDMTAGELLRGVGGRSWPLLASYVLVHAAETVGILGCYIGPIFIMAFFAVTAPVVGAEGVGPLAAMKRSAELASRRYWRVLGISLLIGLVAVLLGLALGGLPELIAILVDEDLAWPVAAAGGIIGAVLSTPFVAAATVLLYLDLRIRTEGLDIELAAIDMAHDAR